MGGDGYSDQSEWQDIFNSVFTVSRFLGMNQRIAWKMNTKVVGKPNTDVGATWTNIMKAISDEMMATFSVFLKEYAMESPTEFVHYKLPHFTPDNLDLLKTVATLNGGIPGRIIF